MTEVAFAQECGVPEVYVDFDRPVHESWPDFLGRMGAADKVIVVCDSAHVKHTQHAPGTQRTVHGLGTHAEWLRIETKLYEKGNERGWLVPLLMDDGDREDVPASLRAWQYERVNSRTWHNPYDKGFQSFWQRLHNTNEYQLPPANVQRMPVWPAEVVSSSLPGR